jgi:hypothetical protein
MNKEMCPKEDLPHLEKTPEYVVGYEQARDIVKDYDFSNALRILTQENILENLIARTKSKYGHSLETATFFTERDWEYLTIIELYSPELAVHSIETYKLLRSKIERIHIGPETIAQAVVREKSSLEEFYRASILHDIGKTLIPESVLNHVAGPGDWLAIDSPAFRSILKSWAVEKHKISSSETFERVDIPSLISDPDFNLFTDVPARTFLTQIEINELQKRNISPELSFREILQLHEEGSKTILENSGLLVEASIAGQHHNYSNKPYEHPTGSLSIGLTAVLVDLLELADKVSALTSKRPYKDSFSRATAFEIVTKDAEGDTTEKREHAAIWIKDFLDNEEIVVENADDVDKIAHMQSFIQTYAPPTN